MVYLFLWLKTKEGSNVLSDAPTPYLNQYAYGDLCEIRDPYRKCIFIGSSLLKS